MNAGQTQREFLLLWAMPLCVAMWLANFSVAAQSYEGKWHRTYLQFTVNVESWGEDCGTRPRSYSSKAIKPTEILQNNGHLFFSTGGLRTDRCNSPNPSLVSLTTSRSANMWTRTCETPAGAGRYENIDYTFSGSGDRLTYRAESSFRWSLDGDLCVVKWVERRTYARVTENAQEAEEQKGDSPVVRVHKDDSFARKKDVQSAPRPECNSPGKAKRLVIAPRSARISPSESLCFQLRGVDANGCRFPVTAKWTASQNGVVQNQRMNSKGCFVAGDNAAESEGVFQIVAAYRGVSTQTTVEVKYPDIGDLALARLDLSGELDGQEAAPNTAFTDKIVPVADTSNKTQAETPITEPPQSVPKRSVGTDWFVWLLVVAISLFVILSIVMGIILLKRSRHKRDKREYTQPNQPISQDARPEKPEPRRTDEQSPGRICLKCGETYPADAKFCPVDATALVSSIPQPQDDVRTSMPPPRGMICPKCQRGYDLGAKFCPHDSTALVEYDNWRKPS